MDIGVVIAFRVDKRDAFTTPVSNVHFLFFWWDFVVKKHPF